LSEKLTAKHCPNNFSDKEFLMSEKIPLPTVVLQSIFVRDHQRRIRLVIELLEAKARRRTPPTKLQNSSATETTRAFTATPHTGGNS
jgi:hypothetical protein